jgi:hypothetical protein
MAGVLEASMADGLFLVESSLPFFVWKKTEKEFGYVEIFRGSSSNE